jgi:hypothetical protein
MSDWKSLPVKSIKVLYTSICIRGKVFAIISIQIELQRELIAIIDLHKATGIQDMTTSNCNKEKHSICNKEKHSIFKTS